MISIRPRTCLPTSCLTALVLFLVVAWPATAGENKWTSQGPFSGAVTAIAIDPQTLDNSALPTPVDITILVGIDGHGIYRSVDGGDSWTEQNVGLPANAPIRDIEIVVDLAVNNASVPEDEPSVAYAATNGFGVFRATILDPDNPPVSLSWVPINTGLQNLFVRSILIDPNEPNIIYAGTNGGGVFRSFDSGATWVEANDGIGQRVIFDLEIPTPWQRGVVINEVQADPSDSVGGPEPGEYIELKGMPLQPFSARLVFYEGGPVPLLGNCGIPSDRDNDDDVYEVWVAAGNFDSNGLFILGNDPSVNNADQVVSFDLRDETVAVAIQNSGGIGTTAGPSGLVDVMFYSFAGEDFDNCLQAAFGILPNGANQILMDNPSVVGPAGPGGVGRDPDGGLRVVPGLFRPLTDSPGQLNRTLLTLMAATDVNGVYRTVERFDVNPKWVPVNNGLGSDVVFSAVSDGDQDLGLGFITCLPHEHNVAVYTGTSGAGVFRNTLPCDTSTLADWELADLPDTTVTSLAVTQPAGLDPTYVWAGTEDGRILRRHTEEEEWDEVLNGLEGVMVSTITTIKRDPLGVYVGTANEIQSSSPPPEGLGGAVFASIDGGANWFQTGPRIEALNGIFTEEVVFDPSDDTGQTLYAGSFGGGVFKSTDGGATWAASNGMNPTWIPPSLTDGISRFVHSLAMENLASPAVPALYAGTDLNGIFKSTDSGVSWSAVNAGLTAGNFSIRDLEVDPNNPNQVYATTGIIWRSVDAGATWFPIMSGFPGDVTVHDVEVDPANSNVLFAGTQGDGIFRTTNATNGNPNLVTWTATNVGLTENFVRTVAIDPNNVDAMAGNSLTVYAGTDGGGVFKSANGGLNWLPLNDGLENLFVLSLAVDTESTNNPATAESQILYAGTIGSGVFRSIDASLAWAPFNAGLTNFVVNDIAIDPFDSRNRYAGTAGGGVFDFIEVERVTVVPTTGLFTGEDGTTANFQVSLTTPPIADVILRFRSSNTDEGMVDPAEVLFTPSSGTTPQNVTIIGVDDGILDNDQAYLIITEPLESPDPRFDGVDANDVSVINIALLPVSIGVAVNPVQGLVTTEAGGQATFDVALTSDPTSSVTIALSVSDASEGSVSPPSLTFSTINATLPQTVTVTGLGDGVIDGDVVYTVVLEPATSADPDYDGLDPNDVSVVNIDDGIGTITLFETANIGSTGQTVGQFINNFTYLGAKFTVSALTDVVAVGGHFAALGANGSIFVAVMPLNGVTNFPTAPFNPGNAIFGTSFIAPATSNEVSVPTNFQLAPGDYAILFGSGHFGATGAALAPGNDSDIGTPQYFSSANSGGSYTDNTFNSTRFFLSAMGGAAAASIFEDGFETGNVLSWSTTVP